MATVGNKKYLFTGLGTNPGVLKKSIKYLRGIEESESHTRVGDLPFNESELIWIKMWILNAHMK